MSPTQSRIALKSPEDLQKMRVAGRVVQAVHNLCREMAKPGVTTLQIDLAAAELIQSKGGKGLFKDYVIDRSIPPFPSNLCISVNEVVVHGIADERVLQEGDVVGVDCGVMVDGWCGDAATTIPVGSIDPAVQKLLDVTQECLNIAIREVRPGRRWSQVARLMEHYAASRGYGVVESFVGHGIGQEMHEPPQVPNYVSREFLRNDIQLREGLVLAIEPMCNLGTKQVEVLGDGWTVVTKDRKPSAHFEHTVAITKNGAEVLTDGN